MMKLSAVLIVKNEEANLTRCLQSIGWVDEIVVVDTGSTDKTVAIAQSMGAKIFNIEWKGFGLSRQYAIEQAAGPWILFIDADEEVSSNLQQEIRDILTAEPACGGYYLPRRTRFLERWISHSGWSPDYVLRLFKKSAGHCNAALVHEQVEVDGSCGRLTNPFLHYSYPTLEDYARKLDLYSTLAAKQMFADGRRARFYQFVIQPPFSFVRKFIFQNGWRDGWEGLLIASLTAVGTLLKLAKLRLLRKKSAVADKSCSCCR